MWSGAGERWYAVRSLSSQVDVMIAAPELAHGPRVMSPSTKDFVDFGIPFLDPFAPT